MSSEVYIPNFSYPLSDYDTAEKYDTALDGIASGNYLFTKDGLWHGGIHFTGAALPDAKKGVQCIADGEVVAYRVNKDYLQNEEDKNTEKGFYSTGFVLVKHKMQYPNDEKALTFFSLYMHIGKLNYMVTTDGAVVRDAQYKETEKLSKGTMLLLDETEIKYPGHESYPRYKILSINGKELSDTRSIYTGTVTKLELDKTVVPSPPIAVKASQTIAPIGEYNLAGGENRKLLHLEVFTGDDFKAFVEKAKEKYPQDKPENKPSPTNVEVPKEKKLYLKTERCKLSQDANIREGFSNTSAIYKNKATTEETTIELDPSASQKVGKYTRVLVTKIGNEDVKGKGLTVIDSVFKDKEVIFTPLDVTTLLKRFKMADLKKEKDSSNIEYMLYDKDAKQYVKYSDCKEQHPVTFEWAEIIEVKSNDFVSIYDDIEKLFIKEMQRDLKLSDSYKELFELIDKNSDHKLDPLELSNAAKDKVLKETVSKFIVQHSSEWDEEVNMAKVFIDIVEKLKDKLTDAETLKKHYKAEQARIEKLAFFKDCKSIDGFPKDHLVYHINPIGMVTEFGTGNIAELRVRAFLRMIRVGEGTVGEKGYETLFGGKSFIKDYKKDWKDHPHIKITSGGYTSSAAGAYQVMGYTWDDKTMKKIRKKHLQVMPDFSPRSQDYFCLALLKYKVKGFAGTLKEKVYNEVYTDNNGKVLSALDLIIEDKIESAIKISAFEWASLPPGVYGQPAESMKKALSLYNKYLIEETQGQSDLHLPKGFLQEFQ